MLFSNTFYASRISNILLTVTPMVMSPVLPPKNPRLLKLINQGVVRRVGLII